MGWEPYDEAEDVPCPQWVGPYDTLAPRPPEDT